MWKFPLITLLFSLSLHAGVITELPEDWTAATPQVAGYAQTIGTTISFDLWNLSGDRNDQTVTLTFDEPVLGFGGWWDNRPHDPGTGICVMDDCFGDAVTFVGFRGWVSDTPFLSIVISTQMGHPGAIRERGLLDNIYVLTEPTPPIIPINPPRAVPEPSTWLLLAMPLAIIGWRKRRG